MKYALEFLAKLRENNNREWFEKHRENYENAKAEVEVLVEKIRQGISDFDVIDTPSAKKSMQRIYRDVRFSKDKTPYKHHFGGQFKRSTKYRRGGFYYHFESGNNFVVAAFWSPEKDDLAWIRSHLAQDIEPLLSITNNPVFIKEFGELKGEKLKVKPKGYEKDHPNIEWLKFKQYLVFKNFSDAEVMKADFHDKVLKAYQQMMPFLNYMSEILTTDLNGEEI